MTRMPWVGLAVSPASRRSETGLREQKLHRRRLRLSVDNLLQSGANVPPRELDLAPRGGRGAPKATAKVLQLRDLLLGAVGAIAGKAGLLTRLGHLLDAILRGILLRYIRRQSRLRLRWVHLRPEAGRVPDIETEKGSGLLKRRGLSD